MRSAVVVLAVVVAVVAAARAQVVRMTPEQTATVQQGIEARAEKDAEELRRFIEASRLGQLSSDEVLGFYRWGLAVRTWKRERGAGVAPVLAEGVLFDCLSRLRGIKGIPLQGGRGMGPTADMPSQYAKDAAKAFDAALKADPTQLEARMRRARIRGTADARALAELEVIAGDSAAPLAYLAAVSRAALAHNKGDHETAKRWYERARALHPASSAAAVGLHALARTVPPLESLDAEDPYYSYPCTVLTPGIQQPLAERIKRLGNVVPR